MRRRRLGRTGLELPVVSFGAWAVGGWQWGGADDEKAVRAIQAAIDCGMDAIDTAPVYGFGHSERVVGRAIAGRRDRVLVMTKIGLRWDDTRGPLAFQTKDPQGRPLPIHNNLRPWSVAWEVERSLERLGIETIDLLQVHWPDPATPIEVTMGALLDLRRAGKIREIGVSNFSVEQMQAARRALGEVPLASDQPKYNLLDRSIEREILPWAREQEIGVLVYSPIEQGLLTGTVPADRTFPSGDGRSTRRTFVPELRARVNEALERVARPIAARHGATVAQVAIAWTIAQPGVTSALVGARTEEQVRENAAAGELALEPGEILALAAAFEGILPAGRSAGLRGFLRRILPR
jgi:aryl-alcohol dehydrogenase-like predicted oxidoreductase